MEVKSVSESIPEDFEAPPSNRSNLQGLIPEENSAIIENREVDSEVKTAAVEHDSSHQEQSAVSEEATEALDVAVETQERSIEK